MAQPVVTCLDMEGVLFPEIWLALADKVGIQELRLTTRDVADYDVLMKKRLEVLKAHRITLRDIQDVASAISPLPGVPDFIAWLRERCQIIILSDTYYEFVGSLMKKLQFPTIFCHTLGVDSHGFITDYFLRQPDQKRHAVSAMKGIGFRVLAGGDSYNDVSMIKEADAGIFFCPPDSIIQEFPQFPVARSYAEFQEHLSRAGGFSS
ncbi:MAG TPA: bifunctional phosphoserine phosphatase/homoserine phosphotransferase ThrH [Parachlamydiaceae bacterium]|nr:bifunctional phosphoserine phosphatase/homoserine phosphotransferase ThrH [Nitrospirales bacterium]MBA3967049.1 bifunctional phosphoserine phosphatase/homoserine phosphotransferase ThrH [Nitrospirales bacterium]HEV8052320.1 bifunctional phosphoserine phosphatase/homoserine phosphotransferase ThrH [Parachlamydiaceae bacterium]